MDERRLDRADDWFDAHGAKLVLLGRLIPGVRSVVSVPAGLSEMPVARFVALTAVGSAVWNTVLISAGWALGSRWREATELMEGLDLWVYIAVAATVALAFGAHRLRRARSES